MPSNKKQVAATCLIAISLLFSPLLRAATLWDAEAGDGAWSTALNWSPNALPTSVDDVTFSSGLGSTITLSTGELANSLLFSSGGYSLVSGDLTLTNGTITVDDGTGATISAVISSVLKGTTLTKAGADTLFLSGANTFTGLTTVSAGVLNIQNATALGTIAGGTAVSSGAALEVQGSITVGAEALTLNGDGISSGGALRNISGTNSFNGNITLASAARINSDAGTLTIAPTAGNALSGAYALTLGGAGNITISKVIAIGAGTITKEGAGTLILSAANTYTGATTVSAGVLNIQSSTALGTNASGTTVASGAALQTQGTLTVTGEALTLNGTGASNTGALRNISGNSSFNGNITLASDTRINSDLNTLTIAPASGAAITGNFNLTLGGAGAITVSKIISIGSGSLTKDGAGTVTLGGANTYTGATAVNAGVLSVLTNSGLGTSASGTTVASGAALQMTGGLSITDEALTLNGTGIASGGALRSISGNNNFNGNITLAGATRINSDLGTLTLNPATGNAISAVDQNLTLGGVGNILVSQAIATGAGTLTKDGAGTVTLMGVNTYTGLTTVSAGVLNIQNNSALGSNAVGTSVTSGAALALQNGITVTDEALTLNGTGILSGGALRSVSGNNNYNGNITLGAATRINSDSGTLTITPASGNAISAANLGVTLGGAGNITINGAIAIGTGTVVKDGAGLLVMTGANTYTGTTTLTAGTLRLAYAANSSMLSNTAALILTSGTIDLAGSVAHNEIVLGTTLNGSVSLTRSTGSSTLNLNALTVSGAGALDFGGDGIATTDTLNVSGVLGGWATINGNWATNSTNAADGAIVAYTGYIDVARLGGTIADGSTTNLRITDAANTSGNMTLSGAGTTTINTLLQGANGGSATIDIGAGNTLRLATGGLLLANGQSALTLGNSGTLTAGTANNIAGTLYLQNQNTANLLTIGSVIANNGTGLVTLDKSGLGTVVLGGVNTYTGITYVGAGALNLQNSAALGTVAAGTIVSNGAALEMQGGISVGAEALTLNGTGVSNGGALRNVSDANTFGGTITLASNSRVNSDAGTLTVDVVAGNAFTGTFNLTLGGAGNITVVDPIATSTGTLTKDGSGTLTLTGANTYTGLTTVSAGVLNIQNATATGTTAGGVVVVNGAALEVQGGITVGAEALTLNGTGISSAGVLRNVAGTNTWGGTVTLGSASTIGTDAGSLTLSGVISGAGMDITKIGAGALILSGTNTYTGATTLNAGVLSIRNSTALGTSASGTTVASGAALEMQGTITITGEALSLSGTGVANGGALRNVLNSNSFNGNISLAADTRVNSDSGTLTITPAAGNAFQGAFNLTLGGAGNITISKVIAIGAGTITKEGAGTLILSAANTYTGATTVSAGVLNIQSSTALGTNASGTTVASGAALQTQGTLTITGEALTLNGTGVGNTGALRSISGNTSFNGNITLASDTRINSDLNTLTIAPASGDGITGNFNLTLGGAGAITVSKIISIGSGSLTKDGAGTALLSGANTYTGATTVNAGVLNIQNASGLGTNASGTTVSSGAALQIQGTLTITGEALTLNGTGVGNTGALRSITNNNSFNGNITLASDTRINADASTLTLNPVSGDAITGTFNLTLGGAGNITVSKPISIGSGTLTKDGAGTLILSGANTYTGVTNVNAGVLSVQNSLGLGTNASGTTVLTGAALNIQNAITITGEALTLNGTGVANGGALRNISSNDSFNGNITLASDTRINSDSGTLTLNPASGDAITGNFNLTLGGVGSIAVSKPITIGSGGLTKDGTGTVTVTGANTYTGATTVSAGVLNIQNSSALGTTASGTTVASGSALQVQNGITVTGEALTLNGTGIANDGALRSISGSNNYNGNITLGAATRINSDAGTLTISPATGNAISATNQNLTLGGAGNTTVNGAIATGTGTLTKDGAGTVILTGANTFTGSTTLNGGTLRLSYGANSSMLSDSAALILTSGTLDLAGTVTHSEVVGSTTVNGAVSITRSAGSSILNLNTITNNAGALNISADNIATTDNLNDVSGILGAWLTVNGQFATNATNSADGSIIAYDGYLNSSRLGGTISSGASNVRITDIGNTSGNITLAAAGTTAINSLLQGASGGTATIDIGATKTLRIANGGILLSSGNGALTFTNTGTLTAGSALNTAATLFLENQDATSLMTVSTVIANNGTGVVGLSKTSGAGTAILFGTNTYTGLTTVSEGTLAYGASNVIATGGVTVDGATAVLDLGLNHSDSVGTIIVDNGGGITGTGTSTLTTTGSFDLRSGSVSAILAGAVVLNKTTAGTVTLSGANTYTGLTTISAGTLAYGASNVIASGGVTVNGATATLDLGANHSDTVGTVILNGGGVITGTGTSTLTSTGSFDLRNGSVSAILGGPNVLLNKTTAGTVTLSGANTYTGLTTVSAGTLAYGASDVIASGGVTVTGASAVLDLGLNHSDTVGAVIVDAGGSLTGTGNSTLTSTSNFDLRSGSVGAILGGAGIGLTKTTAGTVTLSGANTYTGLTNVSAGTLSYGTSNAIATGDVTVNGATAVWDLGASQTDSVGIVTLDGAGSITGSGTSALTSTGTFELKSGSVSVGLGGAGIALNKTTAGTVTLSGANSYTGTTTVSGGTLNLNRSAADNSTILTDGNTATTSDIVINGGNLVLGASEQIADTGSINMSSGSLSFSGSGLIETIDKFTNSGGTFTTGANTFIGLGATTTWSGGTNTISDDGLVQDEHWVISGGTNTVNGGATGGVLEVQAGAAGLFFTGTASPTLILSSSNSVAGSLLLGDDLVVDAGLTSGTAQILSGGALSNKGFIDLGGGTRTLTVNDGVAATDLLVSAVFRNGSIVKAGAGNLELTSSNTYAGTTTVSAGTLTLNNSASNDTTIVTDNDTSTTSDIVINGGTLTIAASEQIANTGSIAMSSGSFNFSGSGRVETIDKLTNSGGTFVTGANTVIGLGSTMTWSGGANTISDGGLVQDTHWVIAGGTNTVNGGTTGGVLEVQAGASGTGLYLTGNSNPTITLDSSNSVAGKILLTNDLVVDAGLTSGTASIVSGGSGANDGRIDLNGGTRTIDVNDGSASTDLLISAKIQNGGIIKSNAGTLELTGDDAFASLVVYAGVVNANAGGGKKALGGATAITVNAGGTLLTGSAQQFNTTASLTLAGGTLNTGGTSQTLGALTLSGSSILDMGTGASILHFAASDIQTWTGTLSVYNWNGNIAPDGGGGTDQLFFGSDASGLTSGQLGSIIFYSDSGTNMYGGAVSILSNGEVTPVPEPSTWICGVLVVAALVGAHRFRRPFARQAGAAGLRHPAARV